MSIYSGFATRTQQSYYNQILYNILSTLLTRIVKFYSREDINEASFLKILVGQDKLIRKLEKRKYLQPKFGELMEYYVGLLRDLVQPNDGRPIRKKEMNRTLSVLDREFNTIRDANERMLLQQKVQDRDRTDVHSLTKIQQKPRNRKKSKAKKSIKSNLNIFQFKAQKKMPQLPSLQPLEHALTRTKFNTKINFSQANSKQISRQISDIDVDDDGQQAYGQITKQKSQRKASLAKPPKFRAKMFFRQKQ